MRIAHLSDPHLMRGPLAALPAANLADAIGRALSIEPRPDCVVITGDLADTGHPDEYGALRTILRRCPIPGHLDGASCATHSVAISHAAAISAF